MIDPKVRKLLVTLHLLFAGFLAPAFFLVAVSGGLYLIGNKGEFKSETLNVPAAASLDFKSKTIDADVRKVLADAGIKHKFEYVKPRGADKIHLRPTSRTYLELTSDGTVKRIKPNLQGSMMELHKGHGPELFKLYQKLVALGLLGVIFGGVLVGLLAPAYRRKTIGSLVFGLIAFLFLALFA